MASDWHKGIQESQRKNFEKEGYDVETEKSIGFKYPVTKENRETRFKQVDIFAQKDDEVVIIEIEDREYNTKEGKREYGANHNELGGILLLVSVFSIRNPDKKVRLELIFKDNIVNFRKNNIKNIIKHFEHDLKPENLVIKDKYKTNLS